MNVPETDETLLTAYALGELDGPERARVAALVDADPAVARFVDEIRETAGLVTGAFERELMDDGLAHVETAVIEQRLREQERALARQRFQPAKVASSGLGQTRWLPFAASMAASVLIVVGALAVLLPRLDGRRAGNDPYAPVPSVTVVGPQEGVERPGLPGDGDTDIANEAFATNAAPGDGGELELDWEPVEGMTDPDAARAELQAQARAAEGAATPVAPAPAPAPAATPKDAAPADAAVARGPARSPEAERVRQPVVNASPKGKGRRAVSASPPRDARSFERIKEDAKKGARPPGRFENPFRDAAARPRSSFPLRVDTASYRAVRKDLLDGKRPPAENVRIEEMLNRFSYNDPKPAEGGPPVAASVEVATCPWNPQNRLARVAIRARDGGAHTVARGVDVSVVFNAETTRAWRLIGYENGPRSPGSSTSFATDLAAGGAATALYEIVPTSPVNPRDKKPKELFTLSVRYEDPQESASGMLDVRAIDSGIGHERASDDFRFATAVAGLGMLLRDSQFKGNVGYEDVVRWAQPGGRRDRETPEREAFLEIAKAARDLLQ